MSIIEQSHNVVDIIHGVIPYNGLEMVIIDNPLFARLHRVYQSSLVYMTYPSNKVHRYEHSLGVMHLSGNFFYSTIRNSEPELIDKLFENVISAYRDEESNWLLKYEPDTLTDMEMTSCGDIYKILEASLPEYSEIEKRKHENNDLENLRFYYNTLFVDNTPTNFVKTRLYYILFESVRLVGLLHDIGHLPYSHVAEHALKELNNSIDVESADKEKYEEFCSIMKKYNSKTRPAHEVVGQYLVSNIFTNLRRFLGKNNEEESFFVTSVFNITWCILTAQTGIFSDLHKIVDSYVDCDRMDYTCRDLYCAGVSKEFPRYERMFNTVKIHFKELPELPEDIEDECADSEAASSSNIEREKCYFAFNSKAIGQIELLLQRRWEDNANLNYHHSVHKHELLLKLVISELGKKYLEDKNNRYSAENNQLPDNICGLWLAMEKASGQGNVDKLFPQLDDEWLNTLIRKYFFDNFGNYYKDEKRRHNLVLWNRLDELVTGRKHYSPVFKRRGGFARFDEAFKSAVMNSNGKDFLCSADVLSNRLVFPAILKEINKEYSGFFSSDRYYDRVNRKVQEWSHKEEAKSMHLEDCLLDSNSFSVGIKGRERENDVLLLSTEKKGEPKLLTEQSLILESLENQRMFFPPFHIFYLPHYDIDKQGYDFVDKQLLSEKVAQIMVDTMIEMKNDAEKAKKAKEVQGTKQETVVSESKNEETTEKARKNKQKLTKKEGL